eukprot:TRINITY_DN121408_c0_g1_i1.p1 TRINITY_DN121408_c0_g1~~TRINITY_DN121408_c0_g1_i1.p1  ORF type:complete len:508 (+),score=65.75 TRINITY_DN121408_c0_g1_i1:129-1652(+)
MSASASCEANDDEDLDEAGKRRKAFRTYILILIAFLSVQFGHGSNIGVAVSLPGNSKAMNLAMGSWVMVGVCLGLPLTPWACRTFGAFRVVVVCVVIDLLVILLMLTPNITLKQIYFVRFLVGFFEAPLLPYLQEWLALFGKHDWNVWNTVLHAMVPVGENLGYIIAQELTALGYSWQFAFLGQAAFLAAMLCGLWLYSGRRYLEIPTGDSKATKDSGSDYIKVNGTDLESVGGGSNKVAPSPTSKAADDGGVNNKDHASSNGELTQYSTEDSLSECAPSVEYPVTERWGVFWSTNTALASQLGFLSGCKYVIRDYAIQRGWSLHTVIFTFSSIALLGPALGGGIAMSGSVIRPDQWSTHKRTLSFLVCVSALAALGAVACLVAPPFLFWFVFFATFVSAGGVYPAAQGIINIALTESRVIEASVYQVQCNNLLFAMPMPYAIGKSMDVLGVDFSMKFVVCIQVVASGLFMVALLVSTFTEERSTWNRLIPPLKGADSDGPSPNALE